MISPKDAAFLADGAIDRASAYEFATCRVWRVDAARWRVTTTVVGNARGYGPESLEACLTWAEQHDALVRTMNRCASTDEAAPEGGRER